MMRQPTTLERLRIFHAIASSGTIAGAARSLNFTPSAVSQHLTSLEDEAGVALVERSNRGVVLTAAGRLLAANASDILDRVHVAFDQVAAAGSQHETSIAIAAFPTAITTMLLPLLDVVAPSIRLTIVDAEAEAALAALRARDVACAITDGHAYEQRERLDDLHRIVLRAEPIRLITRSDRVASTLADCADAPWVIGGPGSRLASAARQACSAAGFIPNVIAETDDHHITFEVMRATGAVSLLPALALVDLPDRLTIATDVDVHLERRIEFVTRPPLRSNPAIVRLAQLLTRDHPEAPEAPLP